MTPKTRLMHQSTQTVLLDPLEAALFLGITPELLFSYVRYAPKQRAGDDRRLPVVQDGPAIKFRRDDLEGFDAYLKEPWSTAAEDRPAIPTYIVDYLKIEAGGQCPRCGKGFKLENAHVLDYATSRSHHHHNLIRICSQCHDAFDDRRILPENELSALKNRLVQRTRERLEAHLYADLQGGCRPTVSPLFIGRETEIEALLRAFQARRRIGIRGIGGIGKTQLLLQALARLKENAEVLWIGVDGFETASALEVALRSVGLGSRASHAQGRSRQANEADFIVFDGIEAVPPAELEKVEELLAGASLASPTARFVFTSQVELHHLELDFDLALEPLSDAASFDVLTGSAGSGRVAIEADPARVAWLLSFSAGHPLSLKIIGGLLSFFKSAETVVTRLQGSGAGQLISPTRTQQTKLTSLEVCLDAAYQALTPPEKRVLFVISHCPAGCYTAMLDRWNNLGIDDLALRMGHIGRWHLVSSNEPGEPSERVSMLSPVRAYVQQVFAKEEQRASDELTLALVDRMTGWACYLDVEYIQEGQVEHGMARFTEEFANFSHLFDVAVNKAKNDRAYLQNIAMLSSALQVFCFLSGRSERGIEIMRCGAGAAEEIGDFRLASDNLLHLQSLARRVGDREAMARSAEEITSLAEGTTDSAIVGNAAMARGVLAKEMGQSEVAECEFDAACDAYERVESQDEEVPEDAPVWVKSNDRMLALALMERALLYEHSSRASQALQTYQRALGLMRKTRDAVNQGAVIHQMGNCHGQLGHRERAYACYLDAAKRFAQISAAIHFSNSISELGYVLLDYRPEQHLREEFPRGVLEYALLDALDECVAMLGPNGAPFPDQECMRLVRKVFGVAIVVSFSPHNTLLEPFVRMMREDVLVPLLATGEGRYPTGHKVPLMHLDITLALIGSVSSKVQAEGAIAVLDEIAHLAALCYRQYEYAWRAFRLFDWLAVYLQRHRGHPGVTAGQLLAAAEATEERGMPFILQGSS